jgi:hypothetical protein
MMNCQTGSYTREHFARMASRGRRRETGRARLVVVALWITLYFVIAPMTVALAINVAKQHGAEAREEQTLRIANDRITARIVRHVHVITSRIDDLLGHRTAVKR